MSRYQITADIDATVWLGVLEGFQYALTNIDYVNYRIMMTFKVFSVKILRKLVISI